MNLWQDLITANNRAEYLPMLRLLWTEMVVGQKAWFASYSRAYSGSGYFSSYYKICKPNWYKISYSLCFSTENWKRPADEVNALMKLFHKQLVESLTDFRDDDVVVRFIGDKSGFSDNLQKLIAETEEVSKDRNGMVLNIAMNYGGRDEILRAAKLLCEDCMSGKISADDITKEMFAQKLYTANQPDPDLIIRPGGEARISNFLLYQAAYSELYITDTLWPDFSEDDLIRAIDYYSKRNRRFGGI